MQFKLEWPELSSIPGLILYSFIMYALSLLIGWFNNGPG
jgi:hypothetical protein